MGYQLRCRRPARQDRSVHLGVDSGWVQNSTLGSEDALAVVSQIAVRVDVAIESNGPHA